MKAQDVMPDRLERAENELDHLREENERLRAEVRMWKHRFNHVCETVKGWEALWLRAKSNS